MAGLQDGFDNLLVNFIGNAIKFAAQEADSLSIKSDCSFLPH